MSNAPSILKLRKIYHEALMANREITLAQAKAKIAQGNLELAVASELVRRCVPQGYMIDFLGDGEVKLENECRPIPEYMLHPDDEPVNTTSTLKEIK